VHKVEINIVDAQALKGGVNSLGHAVMPGVVELCGDPDFFAGNSRVADTLSNLVLVAISKRTGSTVRNVSRTFRSDLRVDVAIALQQSVLNGLSDLVGLGLPCSKTNGRDLVPSVEGVSLPSRSEVVQQLLRPPECASLSIRMRGKISK
jgi:hypothetical protein